jgi:L-lactate dehydrogenase complex protein LldG
VLKEVVNEIENALRDEFLREAVRRYTENYYESLQEILKQFPETEELAGEVRRIREVVIDNLEYLVDKAMKSIERMGGHAYLAKDAEEARRIVGDIVGSGKIIVKSKSLVGEEVGLYEYLTRLGNEVWETDLGELLIRIAGQKPMHMIAPSINMRREDAARILREKLGLEVAEDSPVEEIVRAVREFLRRKYVEAHVGITGANMVAADTGSIILIENEGNIRLSSGFPPVHIVVTGVEKVYPTLIDAFKAAVVAMRYAGYTVSRYINVISGPSATGDIEKIAVRGAHGPRELHVVFVDNGRFKAAGDPVLREALYCIRCGACQLACPIFREVAGYWGGRVYSNGIGVAWTYITEGLTQAGPLSTVCLFMGRCKQTCPLGIDIPKLVREVRRRYMSALLGKR